MAYEKLKSESYQLLGGMNNKPSPYNNSVMEFRELTNFQFSEPGAIDKRPGTTLYTQGSTTNILGLYEYNRLDGSSYLLFNDSVGVWKTSPSGTTFIGGYTAQVGGAPGKGEYQTLQDWAYLSIQQQSINATYAQASYSLRKTEGSTLFLFGLPMYNSFFRVTEGIGITTTSIGTIAGGSLTAGVTTTFRVTFAWQNNLGFIGPASQDTPLAPYTGFYRAIEVDGTTSNSIAISNFLNPSLTNLDPNRAQFGQLTPAESWRWGISAIAIFISQANQTTPFYLTSIPWTTATFTISSLAGLSDIPANNYGLFNFAPKTTPFGNSIAGLEFNLFYHSPILEVYQDLLWMGGFKGYGATFNGPIITYPIAYITGKEFESTVFYQDEDSESPEAFLVQNQLGFVTNDGDYITGLKSYSNSLVVTKNKSIHQITGTTGDNFTTNLVTDVYGCVNNRAMIIYNDLLWMLDRKGIVQFNGANTFIVSIKMDDVFARMNYKAAQKEACALYVKEYNQVWFCFPVDNSEVNNMIVMFDIITNEWSKYEGLLPSVLTMAQGTLPKREPFFGGYTGGIFHFGASFMNDYGASGMTCLFQTPYYAPTGHTTERQFRRFYLDVDPVTGASTPIQLKFLPNFGETVGHTASIYQAPFQSRIDFGIPAKSLSVQGLHFSATLPLKINGYTFESRFQRSV